MKWRSIFKLIPVPVFYTDDMPEVVGGQAKGAIIRIRPRYEDDEGIHQHELAHVELFWATLGLSVFAAMSKMFRIWNEARAYRRQMRYPDAFGHYITLDTAAARLAGPHYGFGLTLEQAKQAILGA
jgi:hypothetical protein